VDLNLLTALPLADGNTVKADLPSHDAPAPGSTVTVTLPDRPVLVAPHD